MSKKGINNITLPVYSEVVKEVPEIVLKAMQEGTIPECMMLIEIDEEDIETPLVDLLNDTQTSALMNSKAIIKCYHDAYQNYKVYYPVRSNPDGTFVRLIRIDISDSALYYIDIDDLGIDINSYCENEEPLNIGVSILSVGSASNEWTQEMEDFVTNTEFPILVITGRFYFKNDDDNFSTIMDNYGTVHTFEFENISIGDPIESYILTTYYVDADRMNDRQGTPVKLESIVYRDTQNNRIVTGLANPTKVDIKLTKEGGQLKIEAPIGFLASFIAIKNATKTAWVRVITTFDNTGSFSTQVDNRNLLDFSSATCDDNSNVMLLDIPSGSPWSINDSYDIDSVVFQSYAGELFDY